MTDKKHLVQVKFPKEFLDRIDNYVSLIRGETENLKNVNIKLDTTYSRSDFVREACEEKLAIAEEPGDEIYSRLKILLERKLSEKDFQKFMVLLMNKVMIRAIEQDLIPPNVSMPFNLQMMQEMFKMVMGSSEDEN